MKRETRDVPSNANQRTRRQALRWPAMLTVSLALHVALVVGIDQQTTTPSWSAETHVVTLEFVDRETVASTQVPAATPGSGALSPTARTSEDAREPRQQRSEPTTESQDSAQPTAPNVDEVAPVVVSAAGLAIAEDGMLDVGPVTRARSETTAANISPRAAARSLIPIDRMPSDGELAEAKLDAALACAGNRRPHLSRRDPPELRRGTDGSYTHEGPGFFATIHRDGHVTFRDRPPVEGHLSPTLLTFDVTDVMLRSMGEELYPAEKRWFMEQTRDLREQLEADDRLHLFARARSELLKTLAAIAANARLSWTEKHAAVFALWADCADDEVGARGRHVIEHFVREHFLAGTASAFTGSELQHLNQRNAAEQRFDPYVDKPRPD